MSNEIDPRVAANRLERGENFAEYCGIGDLQVICKPRDADSKKGDSGRIVLVAGWRYPGAALLASIGAFRMGADLVKLVIPKPLWPVIMQANPAIMLAEPSELEAALSWGDAILVGPGFGDFDFPPELKSILQKLKVPIVLDAEAIPFASSVVKSVLTPHRAELGKLMRQFGATSAREVARKSKCFVIAKAPTDTITDGKNDTYCDRGHTCLTVGGTGDVLAGAIVTLLAQGYTKWEVGRAATYLMGVAGEQLGSKLGNAVMPQEVAKEMASIRAAVTSGGFPRGFPKKS